MSDALRRFVWVSLEETSHAANQVAATTLEQPVPVKTTLQFVVPYTDWALADATLDHLTPLVSGLDAEIELVAVQSMPYPAPMGSALPPYAFLVEQVAGLAERHPLDLRPKVVLARYWDEGFRSALKPGATVVIGTWKRLWRTREERLAHALQREGREVTLWRMERRPRAAQRSH